MSDDIDNWERRTPRVGGGAMPFIVWLALCAGHVIYAMFVGDTFDHVVRDSYFQGSAIVAMCVTGRLWGRG